MGFAGFVLRGRGIGSAASGIAALLLLALMITGCSPPASKAPPPAQTASSQQNNPAPEPSPPAPTPPPPAPAPQSGAAGETAGSNYGVDESGAATGGGGGPGVAYDMSPGGAAPPAAGEAETAAPPHPHRAAKSAPPKLTEEQTRRLLEAERAMEQSDRALAARRREERVGALEGSGGSAPPQPAAFALPEFPWPPPTPSDRMLLPRAGFARGLGANPSLSDAAGRLSDALGQAGYSQYSFYSAPGGFALVARLERIRPDGTPEPEAQRFVPPSATEPFSLGTYLKQLFIAPEGYYRLIVFVVTDNVVVTKGTAPTAAAADIWLRNGADRLPPAYATMPFTKAHEVDALIYEFRKQGKGPATALLPSPLDARAHLQKAGLYSLLAGGAGH